MRVNLTGMRVRVLALLLVLSAAGCGQHTRSQSRAAAAPRPRTTPAAVPAAHCADGDLRRIGSARIAYAGSARHGAVAFRTPAGAELARFGSTNVNDYPTVFGVVGVVVRADCTPSWYRVQLPVKPNGVLGYVRAGSLQLQRVGARIVVDISDRQLTVYDHGKVTLTATVAVGSSATPTPTGRYYVNQRLIPDNTSGPFGPGAIGISAYSNVLTGWTQGGPIAIHGTDEPGSIGHAVSNGCIRLPNATLRKVFTVAFAGTPVIIKA